MKHDGYRRKMVAHALASFLHYRPGDDDNRHYHAKYGRINDGNGISDERIIRDRTHSRIYERNIVPRVVGKAESK